MYYMASLYYSTGVPTKYDIFFHFHLTDEQFTKHEALNFHAIFSLIFVKMNLITSYIFDTPKHVRKIGHHRSEQPSPPENSVYFLKL